MLRCHQWLLGLPSFGAIEILSEALGLVNRPQPGTPPAPTHVEGLGRGFHGFAVFPPWGAGAAIDAGDGRAYPIDSLIGKGLKPEVH